MNEAIKNVCACNPCRGAGCACGCQTAAAPATGNCGAGCQCGADCRCGNCPSHAL